MNRSCNQFQDLQAWTMGLVERTALRMEILSCIPIMRLIILLRLSCLATYFMLQLLCYMSYSVGTYTNYVAYRCILCCYFRMQLLATLYFCLLYVNY